MCLQLVYLTNVILRREEEKLERQTDDARHLLYSQHTCISKKVNNSMRYIDDLLTLNNATLHSVIADIYPSELQLKKTTECGTQLPYLDILITIESMTNETILILIL